MKSLVFGWVALFTLALQVGCCGIQTVDSCGHGCGTGCDGLGMGLRGRIASHLAMNHCSSGCGEVYWDEQINEPPVCDPCGCDNQFIGGSSCGRCPGALSRFRELWGFHYVPNDCSTCSTGHVGAGSCSSCQSYDSGVVVSSGMSIPETVHAVPDSPNSSGHSHGPKQPTPARPKVETAPAPAPTPDENARYRATPRRIPAKTAASRSSLNSGY